MTKTLVDETFSVEWIGSPVEEHHWKVIRLDDGTLAMTRNVKRFDRRYGHKLFLDERREAWLGSSDVNANIHPTLRDGLDDALEGEAA